MSNSQNNELFFKISRLHQTHAQRGHRCAILLNGRIDWSQSVAVEYLQSNDIHPYIHINQSDSIKANEIIGKEYEAAIFHLTEDSNMNLFAALSGTVKANSASSGVVFILINEEKSENRFLQWLLAKFDNFPLPIFYEDGSSKHAELSIYNKNPPPNQVGFDDISCRQQASAIEKIIHLENGRANRPLLLLADRGRGKSAALGLAAFRILKKKPSSKLILTAPSQASTAIVLKHFSSSTKNTESTSNLSFIAPDELIKTLPAANLLMIDEAAGIPITMLTVLLKHYKRIVFSTTTHGYEGTGQAFSVRFISLLKQYTPNWQLLELSAPIRWAKDDPLENLVNNVFMLGKNETRADKNIENEELEFLSITSSEFSKQPKLLQQFYQLLRTAHYKTQPSDLVHLLSSDASQFYILKSGNTIIGAAIVEIEGNIDTNLSQEILKGNRRIQGNILPQSLLMHLGKENAGNFNYLRVVRIAIQPDLQRSGLGSKLISHIIRLAEEKKYDFIGCSFGLTDGLLNFWQTHQFSALRVGFKRNAYSGTYSGLLLRSLNPKSKTLIPECDEHFVNNFIAQLSIAFNEMEPSVIYSLIKQSQFAKDMSISDAILSDVQLFCHNNRNYNDTVFSLQHFLLYSICHIETNNNNCKSNEPFKFNLAIHKIFQQLAWPIICKINQFDGKKQAATELKAGLSRQLNSIRNMNSGSN